MTKVEMRFMKSFEHFYFILTRTVDISNQRKLAEDL